MKKNVLIILFLSLTISVFSGGVQAEPEVNYLIMPGSHDSVWKLSASDGLLIGGYGDNFVYNGKKVVPVGGNAVVEVNADTNTGRMEAVFYGTINPENGVTYTGEIKLVYTRFDEGSDFWEGGIADFIYLHGDTGQEAPVMPKVRTKLASWGPVDVYVDGVLVYEGLIGHMMYTEGSRDGETYAIYNQAGTGYYVPKAPMDSSIAHPDKMELHFVAHTSDSDSGNFPPHTVWIHLNFQTVVEK